MPNLRGTHFIIQKQLSLLLPLPTRWLLL